jgi:transglutaminase-like putative cysteine protease
MQIGRIHSWKKVTAQLLLLALPTAALVFYLLWSVNQFYAVLENQWFKQGWYFTAGIVAATIFYGYRFRFITTAIVLFVIYYGIYKIVGRSTIGEFDAFFFSVQFLVFAILSSAGWLAGYGFSRSRYFTVFWSVFLLALQIVVVSKTADITANIIILSFAPVLVYAFYIIYTAELIRNMNEDEPGFAWFITKRLSGFVVLAGVILMSLLLLFQKDFKALETDWGGGPGGKKESSGRESMTKDKRDGTTSNKDQMKVTGSLSKDKRLVFVAKLDNYFPDGKTANPLYFTSLYYTKFDTLTQTFETDDKMPANDLFKPNPAKIPLYFSKTDSSVIRNTRATLNRKVVSADIYKVILSPDEYIAPSTAFFVQPIPVEKEYKTQFRSAYRAKMWVSDLNSAYFIYNPAGNQMLDAFQQQRFEQLRKASSYTGVEKNFMNYYTFMPSNEEYNRIRELALRITKDAKTPVDKMVAIRDYFLSKDEFGQPMFKYSDNPGVPGLPSASKLNYFLFENRKGYCAYYAGATLFLLRSLGIPSRIAAGFLTVDRSNKNPGWYWFYADQAHAWVQLYFPGYGWMDFDTTVPDVNTQQSPQPDGTPPMNTQKAYLVADGKAVSVDTVAKRVTMKVKKLLYHDQDYETEVPKDMLMDVSIASVTKDTGSAKLSDVKVGTDIVSVSYAEKLKDMEPAPLDTLGSIIERIKKPVPIDEIKIMETELEKKARQQKAAEVDKPFNWVQALWITLGVIGGFILLLFALPWLIWQYFNTRAKRTSDAKAQAYNVYTASMYYLNQLGMPRSQQSPQQYAEEADKKFGTNFNSFTNVYQQLKYSSTPLSNNQQELTRTFFAPFKEKVRSTIPFKTRFSRFLNIYNTLHYFTKPKIR